MKTKQPKDWNLTVKKYFIALIAFMAVACEAPQAPEKEAKLPEWIIPPDKMTDILTDVHVIEGARIGKKVLGDSLYALDYYDKLWEKHGVSEALYDSSFRFYCRNAERMDRMYEEVLVRLSKKSSELAAQGIGEEKDLRRNDD